jgi:hypothetical protein
MFLGIDTEKFHNGIAKYVNITGDAVERAYDFTKQLVGKRWYVMAVPVALSIGIGTYGLLLAAKPDVEIQEAANKKRRKSHLEYWMKYYGQGKQKVKEVTNGGFGGTLEDKIDTQETTK